MKKSLIGLAAMITVLSGCSTMHFDNGSQVTTGSTIDSWHHNAFFALAEISDPVVLSERCRNDDWSTVRNEQTFLNGLAGGAVGAITRIPLWTPQTVAVTCAPLRRD